MRIGLVARAENGRGLGVLCHEFERHMRPDRVLVVRHPSTEALGFPPRLDRYPGAPVVAVEPPGVLDESVVRPWLRGLDVCYCVDSETQAFTNRGWLSYAEIREGDLTLGIDAATHLATWQPIESVHVFPRQIRRMLSIESRDHSSLTTENHRWYIEHQMNGPKPHHRRAENRVRLSKELTRHDRIRRAAPCVNLPIEQKYTDAFVELVAWFYTEGHLSGRGIALTQSERVNPDYCDRIRAALTSLFGPGHDSLRHGRRSDMPAAWREYDRRSPSGCVNWRLNPAASGPLLEVAPGKVVTAEFIHSLTKSQLQLFIDVSMAADNAGRASFGQKDPLRVNAFELAWILLGIATSRYQTKHGIHIVSMHKTTRVWLGEARREWVDHDGEVWCPVTASGSWLARRHGTLYFTGNTAETPYDWRMVDWCREEGVRSVVHAMPESWPVAGVPLPDAVWNPTTWLHDRLPKGARVVPVPVPQDRLVPEPPRTDGPLRLLHVVGHRAWGDRNGTNVLFRALREVRRRVSVRVVTQDAALPAPRGLGRHVSVEVVTGGVEDRWSLYDGVDALVMPRRHGGLCLPVQEAMTRGLAVMMPACEPNGMLPVRPVPAVAGSPTRLSASLTVRPFNANPTRMARELELWAEDPLLLFVDQEAALEWARMHTWEQLGPLYESEFERAMGSERVA